MSRQLRNQDISPNGKSLGKNIKPITTTKKGKGRLCLSNRQATETSSPMVDDSNEEQDDDIAEEDEEPTDTDEEDEIAPSGRNHHKRGHQTGLSMSLSNTGIGNRRRTWSNRAHEEDHMSRPIKVARAETGGSAKNDDEDSDAGYEAVNLISDDEDEDTEHEEEKIIADVEYSREQTTNELVDFSGFVTDDALEEEPNALLNSQIDDIIQDFAFAKSPRQVRFDEKVTYMVTSDSETEEDLALDPFFASTFVPQDDLDPGFRAELEREFNDNDATYLNIQHDDVDELPSNDDNDKSTSRWKLKTWDYESDDGSTTNEDILVPTTILPQNISRSSAPKTARPPVRTAQKQISRSVATPSSSVKRRGPTMGSWAVDPNKPHVVADKSGKNLIIHPAQNSLSRPSTAVTSVANSVTGSPVQCPSTPTNLLPVQSIPSLVLKDPVHLNEDEVFENYVNLGDAHEKNKKEDTDGGDEAGNHDGLMTNRMAAVKRSQQRTARAPRTFKKSKVIKAGRLDLAKQPISPLRIRRRSSDLKTIAANHSAALNSILATQKLLE